LIVGVLGLANAFAAPLMYHESLTRYGMARRASSIAFYSEREIVNCSLYMPIILTMYCAHLNKPKTASYVRRSYTNVFYE
jgi:hypothetical protein